MSRFCRHNRLTVECPICSGGSVADVASGTARRKKQPAPARRPAAATTAPRGPYAAVALDATAEEVRLERVPGGLRLAVWHGGQIARRAPELEPGLLEALVAESEQKGLLEGPRSMDPPRSGAEAAHGASPGRTGETRDELRVERTGEGSVRIARWILRPSAGWQLQDAPVMLPAARFAEALAAAAGRGVREANVRESPAREELDEQQVDG